MQSSTIPAWQQADPKLVRWLWRQLERPGLLQPQHAHQLLARHQGMVAGLPLVESLHRRAAIGADPQAAQMSIVYVTPPPWSPPALASTPTIPATASQRPVVTAVVAAARPASQLSLTRSTVAVSPDAVPLRATSATQTPPALPSAASDSGPTMAIQRKIMPGAASTAPAASAPPTVAAAPVAAPPPPRFGVLPLPPRRFGATSGVTSDMLRPPSFSQTVSPATVSQPVANARRVPTGLADEPTVIPIGQDAGLSPLQTAGQALSASPLPTHPIVRGRPVVQEQRDPMSVLSPVRSAAALPNGVPNLIPGPAATLVVREQVQRERPATTPVPLPRSAEPLPLVVVRAHAPQVVPEHPTVTAPVTDARVAVGHMRPRQSLLAARAAGQMNPAASVAEPQPSTEPTARPGPIDIDGIVDKVHRKFLKTLALEGERRGRS